MSDHLKFWDKTAKRYSEKPIDNEDAYQKKLSITQSYLKPDFDLFEFGCGTGGTSIQHAPFVSSVLATDVSANMLEIAEQRRLESGVENLRFQQMNIETEAIQKEGYDMILGMSIIHLLEDRKSVFENVWQGLKPGGLFVSSTVCIGNKLLLKLLLPLGRRMGKIPYVDFFTEDQLIAELQNSGFSIDQRYSPSDDAAVFLVAKKVN